MAKYNVSREVLNALEEETWRDWDDDITKVLNNGTIRDWVLEPADYAIENERALAVISYVMTGDETLFECVSYTVIANERKYIFGSKGSLLNLVEVSPEDYNMTLDDAKDLYHILRTDNKEILSSSDKVVEGYENMPF